MKDFLRDNESLSEFLQQNASLSEHAVQHIVEADINLEKVRAAPQLMVTCFTCFPIKLCLVPLL